MSPCYHCDLEVPQGTAFKLDVLGQQREFCCPGCLAVAETICANGLEQFYQFRTEKSNKAEELLPQELLEIEALDSPQILESITLNKGDYNEIELGIEGITCAACGWLIRSEINKRNDIIKINVNTSTHRAQLSFKKDAKLSEILKHIHELGYRAYPFTEDAQEAAIQKEDKKFIRRLIVAGLGMMQVMMFATGLYLGEYQDISNEHAFFLHCVSGLLATPVVFYSALPFFTSAWNGLKHKHFGMNLPVSIAIIIGYLASVYSLITRGEVYYFDSIVMFTFFLLLGRFVEHRTRLKAILKQQNFKQLLPLSVQKQHADKSLEVIPTASIQRDDILLINAGAIVPIDGILLDNKAELNEAVITGEFLPVTKNQNEKVYSGATNTGGSFLLQATLSPNESRLQKLIQLQDTSENLLSNKINLADRIANIYVIALLLLAIITASIWYIIDPSQIFPVVLSLLVVSCPCALSLATPAAVAAAIARLTDQGLMIKHRGVLSQLSKVSQVFFDKTGTLTLAEMQLDKIECLSDISSEDVLAIACALEKRSNHPIALAFHKVESKPVNLIQQSETIAGGVAGHIEQNIYRLGKISFALETNKDNELDDFPGKVIVYLSKNKKAIARFILGDTVNNTAQECISNLQSQNKNITILSGDTQSSTNALAQQLNIENVIGDASPERKLTIVEQASVKNTVMMVGDGVNDVGALAKADIAITMGNTSHLSQSSSDAVLVSQDLSIIPDAILTAKKLNQIIRQNLSWAVIYNITAIPFAMAGLVPAWLAAIGMTTSSLLVVLNALRLRQ